MGIRGVQNYEHKNDHQNNIKQEDEETDNNDDEKMEEDKDNNIEEDNIDRDMAPTMPMEMSHKRDDAVRYAATQDISTTMNKKYRTRSKENIRKQKRKNDLPTKLHIRCLAPDKKKRKID